MTREDIENNVGYWQGKANLEYIKQRQEHGVNDPYMITEIDEAFDAGFDKGYEYASNKYERLIKKMLEEDFGTRYADSFIDDLHKAMEE